MTSCYVFDIRNDAIEMALEAFPDETTFLVGEVNFFHAHFEVDLGTMTIVTRVYPNRYFKFDVYERRA